MANTILHIPVGIENLTNLTFELITLNTDTLRAVTVSTLTELTNDKGTYQGIVDADIDNEIVKVNAFINGDLLGKWFAKLYDNTNTYTAGEYTISANAEAVGGARTVNIVVTDGVTPLESAKIRLTKGVLSTLQITDASGEASFNIDDGTWTVAITLAGYTFSGTTLVVSADATETYSMTQVVPTPSNPDFATGYAYCYDENGVIESNVTVYMEIERPSSELGIIYDSEPRSAVSDVNGYVEFTNLVQGATYEIYRGTRARTSVKIGTATTQKLPPVIGTP